MPSSLKNIESQFIRDRLQETPFAQRQYIQDLQKLYHFIKNGAHGFAGNMAFRLLQSQYEREYLHLLQEVSPEKYQVALNSRELRKEQNREKQLQAEEQEIRDLAEWISAGGLR